MQVTKSSKSESNHDHQLWFKNLDQLRRSSGLKIDNKGFWWHHNDRFEHPKIIATLNCGLAWEDQSQNETQEIRSEINEEPVDRQDSECLTSIFEYWIGEATVKVGQQWCYVECDYTPFLVKKLKAMPHQNELYAILNTGQELALGQLGLKQEILYTRLAQDCLARFSVHAQVQVMEWLEEIQPDLQGKSNLKLVYQDREWLIWSS